MINTDRMLERLLELHSFVRPRNRNVFKDVVFSDSEWIEGVYINDPDHFLLITNLGLNWVHDQVMHMVPFESLTAVHLDEIGQWGR